MNFLWNLLDFLTSGWYACGNLDPNIYYQSALFSNHTFSSVMYVWDLLSWLLVASMCLELWSSQLWAMVGVWTWFINILKDFGQVFFQKILELRISSQV